jgi:hypothetical protein
MLTTGQNHLFAPMLHHITVNTYPKKFPRNFPLERSLLLEEGRWYHQPFLTMAILTFWLLPFSKRVQFHRSKVLTLFMHDARYRVQHSATTESNTNNNCSTVYRSCWTNSKLSDNFRHRRCFKILIHLMPYHEQVIWQCEAYLPWGTLWQTG